MIKSDRPSLLDEGLLANEFSPFLLSGPAPANREASDTNVAEAAYERTEVPTASDIPKAFATPQYTGALKAVDVTKHVQVVAGAAAGYHKYVGKLTPGTSRVKRVVIHVLVSDFGHVLNSWHSGAAQYPAHYVISKRGTIAQLVAERLVALHANSANTDSIGIEHDGYYKAPAFFTEDMLRASARLVADICGRHRLPIDRQSIVGHDEVWDSCHGDPGGFWDWDYYLSLVRLAAGQAKVPPLRQIVTRESLTPPSVWAVRKRETIANGPNKAKSWGRTYWGAPSIPGKATTGDNGGDDVVRVAFVAPTLGWYDVSLWFPVYRSNCPSVPVRVFVNDEAVPRIDRVVDQTKARVRRTCALGNTPTWRSQGAVWALADQKVVVEISRRSGDAGLVVADAVRFLRSDRVNAIGLVPEEPTVECMERLEDLCCCRTRDDGARAKCLEKRKLGAADCVSLLKRAKQGPPHGAAPTVPGEIDTTTLEAEVAAFRRELEQDMQAEQTFQTHQPELDVRREEMASPEAEQDEVEHESRHLLSDTMTEEAGDAVESEVINEADDEAPSAAQGGAQAEETSDAVEGEVINEADDEAPSAAQGGVQAEETSDAVEGEVINEADDEAPSAAQLEEYRIGTGFYTPDQRRHAAEHPSGLIRTVTVIGKEEARLVIKGLSPISIGKELTRFKNGALGNFVATFNEFTYYLDEVLRGIGRLRDLLSAGCPEAPKLMTSHQQSALKPTDDRPIFIDRKSTYEAWRTAQARYRAAARDVGPRTKRVVLSRQAFWHAQGELSRTLEKHLDKPTLQLFSVKLADIASVVLAETVAGAATSVFVLGVDLLLEARKNRKEYDAKMIEFLKAVRIRKGLITDEVAAYQAAGNAYWSEVDALHNTLTARDEGRMSARRAAVLFGQSLPAQTESRGAVLGEIRMPALVADAWHGLALNGDAALAKLVAVMDARELVGEAIFHKQTGRPDPFEAEDITKVDMALKRAHKLKSVLDPDQVKIWVATNNAWNARFNEFYR